MDNVNQISPSITLHLSANHPGIWTGSSNSREMEGINSTSILGGLRFWTNALLRTEKRFVCDKKTLCDYKPDEKSKICDACKIFGCTGIARAFSLSVDQYSEYKKNQQYPVYLNDLKYINKEGKTKQPTYYIRTGYTGNFDISLSIVRPLYGSMLYILPEEVLVSLFLMIEFGTIGAYDQYGCGITNFANKEERKKLIEICKNYEFKNGEKNSHGVSLSDFFFFKCNIKNNANNNIKETPFRIRNLIRSDIRNTSSIDATTRHLFCGYLGNRNNNGISYGTKYVLSVDKNGHLYGWGAFPKSNPSYEQCRNTILNIVYKKIKAFSDNNFVWRECDSSRDTFGEIKWPEFFSSLLSSPWRSL